VDINADFTKRAVIRPEDYNWVPSPMAGVDRMMLDRVGDEVARATTIVRFAPNSEFTSHTHVGGEEFFVLEGVFSDEHTDYPAGTYARNPIGTSHTPRIGSAGATILVKLFQYEADDQAQIKIDSHKAPWQQGPSDGLMALPLHSYGTEKVALVKAAPNRDFAAHHHIGGEEIYVLEGIFYDEHGAYPKGTWLRAPHLSAHHAYTKDEGATIFVKTGHLMPASVET